MSNPLSALKDQAVRGYIYRVLCGVGVVLVAKDVITAGDFQVYEALATAVLGLASVNTSVKRD